MSDKIIKVLFVCLGNICRSPTAHGVFQHRVKQLGLDKKIEVDSAGTGSWHIGKAPDNRTSRTAQLRGYDLTALRARQVSEADFYVFDYILAMDKANLSELKAIEPEDFRGELRLFLDFTDTDIEHAEVPDPYYGSGDGFERVLDMVENASEGLLNRIIAKHAL